MAKRTGKPRAEADVESYEHKEAKRKNIPTAENQKLVADEDKAIKKLRWKRNPDLDPQLVWRGKDFESDALEVDAPPIYIQEKILPGAIIEDLRRQTKERRKDDKPQFDFFHDFNCLPEGWKEDATASYYHDEGNWQNRMILGDSLLVMASLAEREGLRGKVQCIYMDPPYGIKFNSNWQPSTKSRKVEDGQYESLSREPEVIRAFRDTWIDGINSYLNYLRDRLVAARDLLSDRGSIFVQISDENVHRVRAILDEVFGAENFVVSIVVKKKGSQIGSTLEAVNDHILWYGKSAKSSGHVTTRPLFVVREDEEILDDYNVVELPTGERVRITELEERDGEAYRQYFGRFRAAYPDAHLLGLNPLKSGGFRKNQSLDFLFRNRRFPIGPNQCWKHTVKDESGGTPGMERLALADRLFPLINDVRFVRYAPEPAVKRISNWWDNLGGAAAPVYVVQTNPEIVKRCILMTTDPGDLVLDPTCGSGTTAFVAEQWGRRWITIDTSRVALTLARARLMGARYDYYLLKDSEDGAQKEGELTGKPPAAGPFTQNIRAGFVLERARWNSSGSVANDTEIDVIWARWQRTLEPLRAKLKEALGKAWEEWEIPREPDDAWSNQAKQLHKEWWEARRARQREIDESIARNAEVEFLYDRPYKAGGVVRVAGPFTVESLSPHRVLPMGEDPYLAELPAAEGVEDSPTHSPPVSPGASEGAEGTRGGAVITDFAQVVYENLKTAGVQNTKKGERLLLENLRPFVSRSGLIQFQGEYNEKGGTKRAAVCIGPEYDTVGYELVRRAAREAADLFDTLVVCGFAFAPEVDETRLNFGTLTVLKARMNQDLRMADKLKASGVGNLFVVFGEPDIKIHEIADHMLKAEILGMDIFDPTTGEVRSSTGKSLMNDVAAWFIDDDYDEESFFVRQAYFVGDDPYDGLKRSLM